MSKQLLRKGMKGQARYRKGWYQISVYERPKLRADGYFYGGKCTFAYVGYKNEFAEKIHEDELRCLDLRGSGAHRLAIYPGMITKCRLPPTAENCSEVDGLDLPAYAAGKVTSVSGGGKGQRISFEFFDKSLVGEEGATDVVRKPSDLLYWGVPTDVTRVDIEPAEPMEDDLAAEESDNEEEEDLPKRKRRAPGIFDPASYKSAITARKKRAIEDSDDDMDIDTSGDGAGKKVNTDYDSSYKELFPDSEEDEEEKSGEDHEGANTQESSSARAAPAGSWGTPIAQSRSGPPASGSWGGISSNAAASSAAASSNGGWNLAISASESTGAWGSANHHIVTPTKSPGGGRGSSSTSATATRAEGSGWGNQSSSGGASSFMTTSSAALTFRQPSRRGSRYESQFATKSGGSLEVYRESADDFFLRWHFGSERIKVVEIGVAQCDALETQRVIGKDDCVLIATKFEKASDLQTPTPYAICNKMAGAHVKAFYLVGNKPNYGPLDAQRELNKIGDSMFVQLCDLFGCRFGGCDVNGGIISDGFYRRSVIYERIVNILIVDSFVS